VDPIFEATGNSSRILSGRKPMSTQSSMLMKRSVIARELGEDLGEAVERPATTECLGVVDDRFEAQHVLAFGVPLQGQQSEVDLEQEEVPLRCLDHDRLPGRQLVAPVVAAAALLDAEQGWQLGHVEAGTGPVDHRVEHGVQLGPVAEQQVAAVLDLVDRVAVAKATALLLMRGSPPPNRPAKPFDSCSSRTAFSTFFHSTPNGGLASR